MAIHRIDITQDKGKLTLSPSPLTVAVGDSVFWRNMDGAQHWITKKGEVKTFWFESPLAPFVEGQPADVTSAVAIDAAQIDYSCIDPAGRDEVDGMIITSAPGT